MQAACLQEELVQVAYLQEELDLELQNSMNDEQTNKQKFDEIENNTISCLRVKVKERRVIRDVQTSFEGYQTPTDNATCATNTISQSINQKQDSVSSSIFFQS